MSIKEHYPRHHKIKNNWEDITRLIALHNRALDKISTLEEKVENLWKKVTKISKYINENE